MATPRKAHAKRPAQRVYVPKGSYQHTADAKYLEAKNQARAVVPEMLARELGWRGVSARMVAQTMGVSLSVVRERMQGKSPWRIDELLGLAAAYDISLADIGITTKGRKPPRPLTEAERRGLSALGLLVGEQLRLDVPA